MADLTALVAGMLLSPAQCQPSINGILHIGVTYASTCSGVASFLQVTYALELVMSSDRADQALEGDLR